MRVHTLCVIAVHLFLGRFSLLLLEFGEIYFEDYSTIYYPNASSESESIDRYYTVYTMYIVHVIHVYMYIPVCTCAHIIHIHPYM